MMSSSRLTLAIREANRFILAAETLAKELEESGKSYVLTGTRKSGACRRASLDLTRALADLRRDKP